MRSFLRLSLVLIIILLAAWIGLWWYAQGRMQAGIANWANQASKNPQMQVTYDGITRSGSPLAAKVTVANLRVTFQPRAPLAPLTAILPSFTMRVDAGDPLTVHYDLPSQINFSTSRGNITLSFGNVAVAQHLNPDALFNAKLPPFKGEDAAASNINVLYSGSLLILHIDSFNGHGTINRSANAGQTALAGTDNFYGIALSPLLTRLGSVPFGGKVAQLALNLNVTGPVPGNLQALQDQFNALPPSDLPARHKIVFSALHDWAAQGGSAAGGITLAVGPSTLNANGAVKFDANVQPEGTANVTMDHLDAFSAALSQAYPKLQGAVALLQAQASPYISASATSGQTLNMRVAYGNGAVNINGQKVRPMPPLDWNALENPAPPLPPPAQAPGDGSGATP